MRPRLSRRVPTSCEGRRPNFLLWEVSDHNALLLRRVQNDAQSLGGDGGGGAEILRLSHAL